MLILKITENVLLPRSQLYSQSDANYIYKLMFEKYL